MEPGNAETIISSLEDLQEDELREVVKRGQSLLAEREKEKRSRVVREIERLAKEHGIEVEVKGAPKRRGRPRKEGPK